MFYSKKVTRAVPKLNPLKNLRAMNKLNPYSIVTRRASILRDLAVKRRRAAGIKKGVSISILILISNKSIVNYDDFDTSWSVFLIFTDINEVLSLLLF